MESALSKPRFMTQNNNSFGSGGMSLAFNEHQFMSFVQFLKQEAGDDLPFRTAATTIGLQKCGAVWVWKRSAY